MTSQALSCKQPSYLLPLHTPVTKSVQLRSSISDLQFAPKVNTNKYWEMGFFMWVRLHYNKCPSNVKSVGNIAKFM